VLRGEFELDKLWRADTEGRDDPELVSVCCAILVIFAVAVIDGLEVEEREGSVDRVTLELVVEDLETTRVTL
jgi:hypothetical protein